MLIRDDNNVTRIINPPLRRNEGRNVRILEDDIAILFILSFVATKPITEWTQVVIWFVIHHGMKYGTVCALSSL